MNITQENEACKDPYWAYLFARDVPGANIRKCEEAACKDPHWAYRFALEIPGADRFALEIPGADIKKCQAAAYKDSYYANLFDQDVLKTKEPPKTSSSPFLDHAYQTFNELVK